MSYWVRFIWSRHKMFGLLPCHSCARSLSVDGIGMLLSPLWVGRIGLTRLSRVFLLGGSAYLFFVGCVCVVCWYGMFGCCFGGWSVVGGCLSGPCTFDFADLVTVFRHACVGCMCVVALTCLVVTVVPVAPSARHWVAEPPCLLMRWIGAWMSIPSYVRRLRTGWRRLSMASRNSCV